jgi:hypothetical protein
MFALNEWTLSSMHPVSRWHKLHRQHTACHTLGSAPPKTAPSNIHLEPFIPWKGEQPSPNESIQVRWLFPNIHLPTQPITRGKKPPLPSSRRQPSWK